MQSSPRHSPQRVFAKTMTRLVSAYIYIHVSFYICMYVYIFTPKLLVLVWETFAFFDHWKAVCIHLHSSFLCLAILRCLPAAASDSISRWFGLERYVFGYYMLAYSTAPTQIVLMLLCVVTWLGLTGHKACSCKKGCTCLFPTDVCINGGTAKTMPKQSALLGLIQPENILRNLRSIFPFTHWNSCDPMGCCQNKERNGMESRWKVIK